jgi:hypothetical protein
VFHLDVAKVYLVMLLGSHLPQLSTAAIGAPSSRHRRPAGEAEEVQAVPRGVKRRRLGRHGPQVARETECRRECPDVQVLALQFFSSHGAIVPHSLACPVALL